MDNIDNYMNYENNILYSLIFVEDGAEYSFLNNIAPTILNIITSKYKLLNNNYYNKLPDIRNRNY